MSHNAGIAQKHSWKYSDILSVLFLCGLVFAWTDTSHYSGITFSPVILWKHKRVKMSQWPVTPDLSSLLGLISEQRKQQFHTDITKQQRWKSHTMPIFCIVQMTCICQGNICKKKTRNLSKFIWMIILRKSVQVYKMPHHSSITLYIPA